MAAFNNAGWATGGEHVFGTNFNAVGFTGKIIAHGIAGGVMSSLQGGKFGNGFASAGVAQAFSGGIDHLDAGSTGVSAQRVLAAAILGGTTSMIAGGKFANGAATGAFSRAFNEEAHRMANGNVEINRDDGTTETRAGGSLSWRDYNPGNMIAGSGDYQPIGYNNRFAIFSNEETGFDAIVNNLSSQRYQNLTVGGAISTWAPGADGNDPTHYTETVSSWTGISADTQMNTLTTAQLQSVASVIQRFEGWSPGTVTITHPEVPQNPNNIYQPYSFIPR